MSSDHSAVLKFTHIIHTINLSVASCIVMYIALARFSVMVHHCRYVVVWHFGICTIHALTTIWFVFGYYISVLVLFQ